MSSETPSPRPAFGRRLRELRTAAGLSLRDVASLTGGALTPAALSRIERTERSPTLRTLEAVAKALGLRITINPEGTRVDPLEQP